MTDTSSLGSKLPSHGRYGALQRLIRFGLNTHDARRLTDFYVTAFGAAVSFQRHQSGVRSEARMNVRGGADCWTLNLGSARLEILEFDRAGQPYPEPLAPYDAEFQHFALVVTDMGSAYRRLSQTHGWSPISNAGPQRLPARAGDVTAFKFRDPDGHPLELLCFAPGGGPLQWRSGGSTQNVLGIDHSAISVSDVERSIAFYEELGLTVAARQVNRGPEQQLLDGVPEPVVDVIALAPLEATPHVELLGYHGGLRQVRGTVKSNDIAATRLVFQARSTSKATEPAADAAGAGVQARTGTAAEPAGIASIRDPDGHFLEIE